MIRYLVWIVCITMAIRCWPMGGYLHPGTAGWIGSLVYSFFAYRCADRLGECDPRKENP